MKNITYKSNYRPDIQGLRAVAVLLVVIYHSGIGYFPGGYIGVDVFFVISGYLITGLLLRELERSGSVDLARFYARRIRRLLPAATVMLVVTIATAWFLYSPLEMKQFGSSAFATAIYLSNVWFAHLSTDYLAEDTNVNPLLHTWSLSAEEQFYIVWPIFVLILARMAMSSTIYKNVFKGVAALTIISFIAAVLLTKYNQPWAFFSSPTRAWEFGLGGMIALIPHGRFKLSKFKSVCCGFAGLILILLTACFYNTGVSFPGFAAILPAMGASLLIGACHASPIVGVNRWISAKPMQFIGDISYSLYLWHWPIFVFMGFLYPNIGIAVKLSGILLSFFLAWVTVLLVENPFRYSSFLTQKVRVSVALGLIFTVSSASFALIIREISAVGIESPSQQRYFAAEKDIPRIYEEGCHAQFLQVDMPDCIYGSSTATKTIVLFGDSHAAQWFPALEALSERHGWRLVSITKTSCPSMSFEPFDNQMNRAYTECTQWREKAFERISELKPHITILANSNNYLSENEEGVITIPDFEIWRKSVKETLIRLSEYSTSVVIMRDTPWLDFRAPICLSRADWQEKKPAEICSFNAINARSKEFFELEKQEIAVLSQGLMIDMTNIICPERQWQCAVERDGLVLYHDAHHLSASFSRAMADALYKKLEPIQVHHATSRNPGTPVAIIRSPTQRMGDALNALRP